MIHPIFSVLITRPELVVDHLSGYAALVQEEASTAGGQVARMAAGWGAVAIGALLFVIFAGVAVMIGATVGEFHWALVVVPALPLALAVAGFMMTRKPSPAKAFSELRSQLDADVQALRTIGAKA
jgi:peptidoglycan/LPS O-acetylase OafA/YrhL